MKDEKPILMVEPPRVARILNAWVVIGLGVFGAYMLVSLELFAKSPWFRVLFLLGIVTMIIRGVLDLTRYYRVCLFSDRMEIRMPYAPTKSRSYSDVQRFSLQRHAGKYNPPLTVHFRDGYPLFIPSSHAFDAMELIQQRSPVAIEGYERRA